MESTPIPEPAPELPDAAAAPDPRLAELAAERDAARQELDRLRLRHQALELAREYQFTDPEYLEYLCQRDQPALAEETGRAAFMAGLRERSPRLFRLTLEPGPPAAAPRSPVPPPPRTGAEAIARLLADVPELP